jgi:hypothetical protein
VQVLTGEIPFHGVRHTDLGYLVVQGLRPTKPGNASAIGFSDLLWSFVQRCWDGDMNVRPKVTEVVAHLENAATNWNGLMPPCIQAENIASGPQEGMSDSMQHCEFEILIPLCIIHRTTVQVESFNVRALVRRVPPTHSPPLDCSATRAHHPPSAPNCHRKSL